MIHRVKVSSDGSTDARELSVSVGDVVELWADNVVITYLYVTGTQAVCVDCPLHKSVRNEVCPMNHGYPLCYGYLENRPEFIAFKEISLEDL